MSESSPTQQQLRTFSQTSRDQQLAIYWGFLWRGLIMNLAVLVVSFVSSFIVAAIMTFFRGFFGSPYEGFFLSDLVVSMLVGLGLGAYSLFLWMKWVFKSRFGSLRLAVVED